MFGDWSQVTLENFHLHPWIMADVLAIAGIVAVLVFAICCVWCFYLMLTEGHYQRPEEYGGETTSRLER